MKAFLAIAVALVVVSISQACNPPVQLQAQGAQCYGMNQAVQSFAVQQQYAVPVQSFAVQSFAVQSFAVQQFAAQQVGYGYGGGVNIGVGLRGVGLRRGLGLGGLNRGRGVRRLR